MTAQVYGKLVLSEFGERDAFEARSRGYFSGGVVVFDDGRRYPVVFYDPVRLGQDLATESSEGRPFLSEPGLIVVSEVTLETMNAAVQRLILEGYFGHFVPSM